MSSFRKLWSIDYICRFLIVLIALGLVVVWYRERLPMGTAEGGIAFYNSAKSFDLTRYTWYESSLGASVPQFQVAAPFFLFLSLIERLSVPVWVVQASLYSAVLIVAGFSVYSLIYYEVSERQYLPALVGAVFYIFNPFAMNVVWHRFMQNGIFFYALLPLALLLFMKGLRRRNIAYVIYLNFALLLFSFSFSQVAFLLTIFFALLSYLLFFIFVNFRDRPTLWFALKFSFLSLLIWLLFNAWWLGSFLVTVGWLGNVAYSQALNVATFQEVSRFTTLLDVLRLVSHWYTYIETNFLPIYSSGVFEAISFIVPILSFFGFVALKRRSQNFIFFALLAVASIFFAKGAAPPLGGIFEWVFRNVRILEPLRGSFEKLGVITVLSYAPLFGIGVSRVYEITKELIDRSSLGFLKLRGRTLAFILSTLLLSATLVYVWPLWTGSVFMLPNALHNKSYESYGVEVPLYYSSANSWIRARAGNTRIVSLPIVWEGVTYNWRHGYSGVELGDQLFDNPVISFASALVPDSRIITLNFEKALLSDKISFFKIAGLVNAKYIVVHRDMDYKIRRLTPFSEIIRSLKPMRPVKTFGKLDIFKIADEFFFPHVYAATDPKVLVQGVDDLLSAIKNSRPSPSKRSVFFLMHPGEAIDTLRTEKLRVKIKQPEVDFEMLSPVAYRVKIRNSKGPFYLILSESFHPQWKAYKGRVNWLQALWSKPIGEETHWRANGYANSWYLDEKGDFELTLYFWPQSLFYLGAIVSGLTLIGSAGFLFYDWRRTWGLVRR